MKREFTLKELQDIRSFWWDEAQAGRYGDKLPKLYEALACVRNAYAAANGGHTNTLKINLSDGIVIDATLAMTKTERRWSGPLTVTCADGVVLVDTQKQLYIPGKWEVEFREIHARLMQEKKEAEDSRESEQAETLRCELLLTENGQHEKAQQALDDMRGLA